MLFDHILQRFVRQSPACVLARLALGHIFQPEILNRLFERTAQRQYTKELTFATVVDLMAQVVTRCQPSLCAAYEDAEDLPVSLTALYDKVNHTEPLTSEVLVASTAERLADVMRPWRNPRPEPIPGLTLYTVDGNALAGTHHRLAELRDSTAAALPGMSVCVLEQATGLIRRVWLREDAYTGERTLIEPLLTMVRPGQLWLADRNFCTLEMLHGIAGRPAYFVIRHHAQVHLQPVGERHYVGETATGRVCEQEVRVGTGADARVYRCVEVHLKKPTRDGETVIRLLTNLSASQASAVQVAEVYRERWQIETGFQQLTDYLRCEVESLGYPRAALFAFALAVVAYNVLALMRAALARVRGWAAVREGLSSYYLAREWSRVYGGMSIAVEPTVWSPLESLSPEAMAALLEEVAGAIPAGKYRKRRRGPKKPPQKQKSGRGAHRSTARVLKGRKNRTTAP